LESDIIQNIKRFSIQKNLPDGSSYASISIEHTLHLSELLQISSRDIEIAALEENIIPEHYARNMKTFSPKEQSILLRSQASIVGLGGLGGTVTEILARLGVGTLVLIESDVFEESNLNRQVLSTFSCLESSKIEAAVKRVKEINPVILVKGHDEFLDRNNAVNLIENSDVVIDCLDNISTRFLLEAATKKVGSPLVSAAVAGIYGHVTSIFPKDRGLELVYGGNDILPAKGAEASLGCLPNAVILLAALETSEVIKILLKKGSVLRNQLAVIDLNDNIFEVLDLL
jgi:molybdopterin-synthase adenylyltransferase